MRKSTWMWLGLSLALASAAAAQTVNRIPKYITSSTFGDSVITELNGNVGIGTTSPGGKLDVSGLGGLVVAAGSNLGPSSGYSLTPIEGTGKLLIGWNRSDGSEETDFISSNAGSIATGGFNFYEYSSAGVLNSLVAIEGTGNVGIGTTSPGAKLDVAGLIHTSTGILFPDGNTQSMAYTGVTCGGDYAESVDVAGDRKHYEPGDVLVIDPNAPGKFLKSDGPYSTAVMGVYSTKPGTVGRRQTTPKSDDEVPMAMIGIVPIKVSAENGKISPGDLLVTSSIPGYAMKGADRSRMLGAVIGKALGNLDSGTGVIEVGVTLQ